MKTSMPLSKKDELKVFENIALLYKSDPTKFSKLEKNDKKEDKADRVEDRENTTKKIKSRVPKK